MAMFKSKKWKEKTSRYFPNAVKTNEQQEDSVIKPEAVEGQQPAKNVETAKKSVNAIKEADSHLEFQAKYGLTEKTPTKTFFPKPVIKPLIKKQLTIILVENTATVSKEKETVLQIVKNFAKSDLTCIINYGKTVMQSEIFEISNLQDFIVSYNEMTGEETCLFDALIQAEKIVESKYLLIEENTKDRIQIDNIQIIGIGTCRDNASVASKEEALSSFYKTASKVKVATKYFCLSEEYFIEAAEFGFHSIGAIPKSFQ